ncbi:MAG: hypothetical protein KGY60_04065 [Bacteroidales bacterium]|nr:hypothetical protein [Bacteroidales bacterium]
MKHIMYEGKSISERIRSASPDTIPAGFLPPGNFIRKALMWTAFLFLPLLVVPVALQAQPENGSKEIFMWVGAQKLQKEQPATLENMLLFAKRFHIIPYSSGMNDPDKLRGFLSACREHGIDSTWIEIGPGKDITIRRFVEDISSREAVAKRFKELASIYREYYPDFARITLFDEAPLGAFKQPEDTAVKGYSGLYRNFMKYGPQAFFLLSKAIKQEMPDAEVGIFLHHPHNAPPALSEDYSSIALFMEACRYRSELSKSLGISVETTGDASVEADCYPDFIFSDVYRGYFTRGYGREATNEYIREVARYTKEIGRQYDARAYQLGQMHTIKLGYTPSKVEIDQNVEAMVDGGLDGMGWYWPNYASTNYIRTSGSGIGKPTDAPVSFDPFVPNAWGSTGPAGSVYATSKDRFVYSYLRMLEEDGRVHPTTHFDLWLYGYDFDHAEHQLYLRTNKAHGDRWELIGHFNPQHDAGAYEPGARSKYIYSYHERWHALAFRGLDRDRYITDNQGQKELHVKIETPQKTDHSKISAIYAMPYRSTQNYATEDQITSYIEKQPRWVETNALINQVRPVPAVLKKSQTFKMILR